jgi:hypothetical protein
MRAFLEVDQQNIDFVYSFSVWFRLISGYCLIINPSITIFICESKYRTFAPKRYDLGIFV